MAVITGSSYDWPGTTGVWCLVKGEARRRINTNPGDRAATLPNVARASEIDQEQVAQWELFARAVERTQQRVLGRVEELGVPAAWFAVLHELLSHREHRLPMSRLARELSMTSGGFTKLADRWRRKVSSIAGLRSVTVAWFSRH